MRRALLFLEYNSACKTDLLPDGVVPVYQEADIVPTWFFDNLVKFHTADVCKVRGFSEDLVNLVLTEQEEQACGRTFFRIGCDFHSIVAAGLPPFPAKLRCKMFLCPEI